MTMLRTTVAPTAVREDWCHVCKAYTRLTVDLLLLTPCGVTTVGTWAWCEICDDPTDQPQEAARG
ncbi:hypothetical protein OG272_15735 [Streptomyces sp. NBC_00104]|uniref:hypothetical protein n=1 Tax=unclassified Streptomyces TaxID=2593676 RepID=UPI0032514541